MKGKKIYLFSTICLILAVCFAIGAVATGGLKKETWAKANRNLREFAGLYPEPKHIENYVIDSDEVARITKLYVNNSDGIVSIQYGDEDQTEIIADYYEDYKGQKAVWIDEYGVLNIHRKDKWTFHPAQLLNMDWYFNKNAGNITVTLPRSVSFESTSIKQSDGNICIAGASDFADLKPLQLGKITSIKQSDGDISFWNCKIASISSVTISDGIITLTDCDVDGNIVINKISDGRFRIFGGNINDVYCSKISDGGITIEDVLSIGSIYIDKISDGKTYLTNLPIEIPYTHFNIGKISDGSFTLNGVEQGEGYISHAGLECKHLISIGKISDGKVVITIKE